MNTAFFNFHIYLFEFLKLKYFLYICNLKVILTWQLEKQ